MDILAQGETTKSKPVMADRGIDEARPAAGIGTGVHVDALDGIRGLAILLVMAFHYGNSAKDFGFQNILLSASGLGWLGVDLFFALSGFLITGILYDAKDKSHYFPQLLCASVPADLPALLPGAAGRRHSRLRLARGPASGPPAAPVTSPAI